MKHYKATIAPDVTLSFEFDAENSTEATNEALNRFKNMTKEEILENLTGVNFLRKYEVIEIQPPVLSKEETDKVCVLLGFPIEDFDGATIADEDENFVLIYLNLRDMYNGANFTILRNKKTNEILVPFSEQYPMCLKETNTYVYHSLDEEPTEGDRTNIILTDKMEKITMDKNLQDKLVYLNNCRAADENGAIFGNGVTFVWLKNHTLCVKSASRSGKAYIAVYKHRKDVIPTKLYEETRVNHTFPENK